MFRVFLGAYGRSHPKNCSVFLCLVWQARNTGNRSPQGYSSSVKNVRVWWLGGWLNNNSSRESRIFHSSRDIIREGISISAYSLKGGMFIVSNFQFFWFHLKDRPLQEPLSSQGYRRPILTRTLTGQDLQGGYGSRENIRNTAENKKNYIIIHQLLCI